MNGIQTLDSFQLHNNAVAHHEVQPIDADDLPAITYGKSLFTTKWNATCGQFHAHGISIYRLRVSRADLPMYSDSGVDHIRDASLGSFIEMRNNSDHFNLLRALRAFVVFVFVPSWFTFRRFSASVSFP